MLSSPMNVNVTKITWRPVGTRTRRLESWDPSGSASNAETRYFCAVKLRVYLVSFMDFTTLFVSSWAWITVRCNFWSMESTNFGWIPFCSLRVVPL